MYDFANILFSGKCSARCSFCIGHELDPRLNRPNLDIYPPLNLSKFLYRVQEYHINQVVLTGTNSDPQLYQFEKELLGNLRKNLSEQVQIALHTNGRQALWKIEILNAYDRITISIPSFNRETYRKMMGVSGIPDMEKILAFSHRPIKVSCLLDDQNLPELSSYLETCISIGIRRVVLRKKYADMRNWDSLLNLSTLGLDPVGLFRGNPVYEKRGMEVTLWDFNQTLSRSINLFSNGLISDQYLLVKANYINPTRDPIQDCSFSGFTV